MRCGDKGIAGRTLLQTRQHVEDAAPTIVEQEDTQITTQVLIPQGILIVEETQVANDTKHPIIRHHREACCRRERTLDAIHTTITPHWMLGKYVCQTDGGAVGIMDLGFTHKTFEILHCRHLGVGWFISIGLLTDTGKQLIPLLHKGMGLHHHHETDMISHCLTIALEDVREIHEGVIDLA